jgi:hypothetical protein
MVPYRLLFFLTTKDYFKNLASFSNSIYRTLFPIINYLYFIFIFIFAWGLGIYKALNKYNLEYENLL